MIFWMLAYTFSLVLINLHTTSIINKVNTKARLRVQIAFCFSLCLHLFALSTFVIKAMVVFEIESTTQVFLITIGGVPLFISVWLAIPINHFKRD